MLTDVSCDIETVAVPVAEQVCGGDKVCDADLTPLPVLLVVPSLVGEALNEASIVMLDVVVLLGDAVLFDFVWDTSTEDDRVRDFSADTLRDLLCSNEPEILTWYN